MNPPKSVFDCIDRGREISRATDYLSIFFLALFEEAHSMAAVKVQSPPPVESPPPPFTPAVKEGSSVFAVVGSIILYCSSTLFLLTFNKWFFSYRKDFGYILTITWGQQFFVVLLLLSCQTCLARFMGSIDYSWAPLRRVAPVGVLATLDYSLSNLALKMVPMTVYEIVKSCSPAVVLIASICMGLMKPSLVLGVIVAAIVVGAAIAVGVGHGSVPHQPEAARVNHTVARAILTTFHESIAPTATLAGTTAAVSSSSSPSGMSQYLSALDPQTQGFILITIATVVSALKSVAAQITLHGSSHGKPSAPGDSGSSSSASKAIAGPGPSHSGAGATSGDHTPPQRPHTPPPTKDATATPQGFQITVTQNDGAQRDAVKEAPSPTGHEEPYVPPVNPITTTFFSALVMMITLLPAVIWKEGRQVMAWRETASREDQYVTAGLIAASSILSVLVSISSFLVMKHTSALTYAVVALGERVLIVLAAIVILGEALPLLNAMGFGLTLSGIACYNWYKLRGSYEGPNRKEEIGPKDSFAAKRLSHRKFSYSSAPSFTDFSGSLSPRMRSPIRSRGYAPSREKEPLVRRGGAAGGGSYHRTQATVSFETAETESQSFNAELRRAAVGTSAVPHRGAAAAPSPVPPKPSMLTPSYGATGNRHPAH